MAEPDPAPSGVIANPPKGVSSPLLPLFVSVNMYSVPGVYLPEKEEVLAAARAGEKDRE
jgi:hypothetical protein